MPKVARLEVIATGARRRWTVEEKRRIVAESYGGPRQVSTTARRHGLSASQLFAWRRLTREGRLSADDGGMRFARAVIACEPSPSGPQRFPEPLEAADPSPSLSKAARCRMEIVLASGHRVIVDKDVDAVALGRVLGVLARS
jgi:transposase